MEPQLNYEHTVVDKLKSYNNGAFKVIVIKIEITETIKDSTTTNRPIAIATIEFKKVADGKTIMLPRIIIEEKPFGKYEMNYDVMHELFNIMEITNSVQLINARERNIEKVNEIFQKGIGVELIILVNSLFGYTETHGVSEKTLLSVALHADGTSQFEREQKVMNRGTLLDFAERLVPMTTKSYREKHECVVPEVANNLSLLTDNFQRYIDRKKENDARFE